MKKIDLVGMKISGWTVLEESTRLRYVLCQCACGVIKDVFKSAIINGTSKSCGCLGREATIKANIKHGISQLDNRFYSIHTNMMCRCYNTKNKRYHKYGGAGILVQDSWHKVGAFYSEMYDSYLKCMEATEGRASIERIDNLLGYSSDNCIWIDSRDQVFHREPQSRNTTGEAGVIFDSKRGNRYVASYREYVTSKQYRKAFTFAKCGGRDAALALAISWRRERILEQIARGAPYKEL